MSGCNPFDLQYNRDKQFIPQKEIAYEWIPRISRQTGYAHATELSQELESIVIIYGLVPNATLKLILWALSYGMMIWAIFRCLSRNTYKRYQENRKYLQLLDRVKDREHRYFDCPKCHQRVRVPRGKGKISISCPRCKEKFVRQT